MATNTKTILSPQLIARVVSTAANLALTGAATINGVVLADGDIVWAARQTAKAQNGPWIVNTAGAWLRPLDWVAGKVFAGMTCIISEGVDSVSSINWAGSVWGITTTGAITPDATAIDTYPRTYHGTGALTNGNLVVANIWLLSTTTSSIIPYYNTAKTLGTSPALGVPTRVAGIPGTGTFTIGNGTGAGDSTSTVDFEVVNF